MTVRDAATLRVLERFSVPPIAGEPPTAYALSGDDRTVAIGSEDGSVRLLDLDSGQLRTASGRHRAPVNDASFTPDSRTLVTAGQDGDVIVWDVRQAAAARDAHRPPGQRVLSRDRRRRPDALHRQPRRHGADLGSERQPSAGATVHGRCAGQPALRAQLRRPPAGARSARRPGQPGRDVDADAARAVPGREGDRDRRPGLGRGHRVRAGQPSARRRGHVRVRRAWSTRTAARSSSSWPGTQRKNAIGAR